MKIFHSAHSPDDLAAKLARLKELEHDFAAAVERAKIAVVKEFAYGAGHEINNPLANISARAQTLLREEANHDKRHKLATIIAQAQRAHEMITDLMLFAKPPKLELEAVNLRTWLPTILSDLQKSAEEKQHRFIFDASEIEDIENPEVKIDPVQLAVAIRAIMTNSLEAMRESGEIVVKIVDAPNADEQDEGENQSLTPNLGIVIRDNGPGMSAETREHLFDPFFSGREAGRGLGFGLCKAWRIVDEHGGRIAVQI
jgi:signal transduction histidine kinase